MAHPLFRIEPARTKADIEAAITLFRAYANSLEIDLDYQGFSAEIASMPGNYAPPRGELLLASDSWGIAAGCVGLRPLEAPGVCEMKRLYVCPAARGSGLGQHLVESLIDIAQAIGYREMRLDTLPSMKGAQALYRRSGFEVAEPYYPTPVGGTLFMRRRLVPAQ